MVSTSTTTFSIAVTSSAPSARMALEIAAPASARNVPVTEHFVVRQPAAGIEDPFAYPKTDSLADPLPEGVQTVYHCAVEVVIFVDGEGSHGQTENQGW